MPAHVSLIALVEAGAEHLLPADLVALITPAIDCQDDAAPLWVLADALAEAGEPVLERAVRYMAKRGRRPSRWEPAATSMPVWEWVGGAGRDYAIAHPGCLPPYMSTSRGVATSQHRANTWLAAVAWLGRRIAAIEFDLDVDKPD